jgi:putative flippase GtrA
MTDRDWDAEMRKIDKQIASIPAQGATPARPGAPPGAAPPAVSPAGASLAASRRETSTFGVMARLTLACALGVAILFWPYGAKCGVGLSAYLAAVTTLVVAGVWASIWTWKHRAAKAHTVSLVLVTWGLVLAAADVLPRVGYAKPTLNHPASWTCP